MNDKRRQTIATALVVTLAEIVVLAAGLWWLLHVRFGALGSDLTSYTMAADRLRVTGSPYSTELLAGPIANIPENVPIGYLYPPPLAQLISILPAPVVQPLVWCGAQALGLVAIAVATGRRANLDGRRAWALWWTAWVAYFPIHMAVWIGNVSGWIAVGVGCLLLTDSPRKVGTTAVILAVGKGVTAPIGAAALVAARTRSSALAAAGLLVGVSLVASVAAWRDFSVVVRHLPGMQMGTPPANLSLDAVLMGTSLEAFGYPARIAAAVCLGIWVLRAVRQGQVRRALAISALATLLLSATAWDHHFALVAPIVAIGWSGASRLVKTVVVVGLAGQLIWWTGLTGSRPLLLLGILSIWAAGLAAASAIGDLGTPTGPGFAARAKALSSRVLSPWRVVQFVRPLVADPDADVLVRSP